MTSRPDAKVLFRVANEDGSAEVETVWATNLGDDHFRLANSPFWAYGVSWEDTVLAPFSAREGHPTFMAVLSKSGNRTVRVALDPPLEDGNDSDVMVQGLVALGCSYERANRRYIAVNVPPDVELNDVRNYLIAEDAIWEHADPTYASLFPDDT